MRYACHAGARIFLSPRFYVSREIDNETRVRLTTGDADGTALEPEEQFPEGVVATQVDGQKVFLGQGFVDIVKHRNRGRD